jgi:hypothetical protein
VFRLVDYPGIQALDRDRPAFDGEDVPIDWNRSSCRQRVRLDIAKYRWL